MSDWSLPSSWVEVPIADIADINSKAFSPLTDTPDLSATFVSMSHVAAEFGGIDVSSARPLGDVARGYASFIEGDVLFAKITPCMENGKVAVVPKLPESVGFGSTEFHVLRATEATHPRWLAYYLSRREFRRQARQEMTGSAGQLRVSSSWLSSKAIPLAPRHEQTRIVEKLDELLTDLDAGVAELEAAQRKLARYRQSLLKAAVEGTLTADWRAERALRGETVETGSQLLDRILRERRARWEEKQLAKFEEKKRNPPKDWQSEYVEPAAPQADSGDDVPAAWQLATLDQLLDMLSSGSRDWSAFYGCGTSTFVMAQNVRPWRPDFSFRQPVDPPLDHRDRARSAIAKDDLLITIVGANTGQACRVPDQLEDHFVCQSVALIRLVEPALAEFVNAVLNSPAHGQRQFREMNYGAGRPHLSFEQLGSVLVPLPPLAEQAVILERLTSAMDTTTDVEMQIQSTAKALSAQRQNILRAAFSGRLVPQDPADEPASALLERIRAERAAGDGSAKKSRGRRKAPEPA